MNNYDKIIENKGGRYALYKDPNSNHYSIVDTFRRALLIIDDPIIDYKILVEQLLSREFQVYNYLEELPQPREFPLSNKSVPFKYPLFIKDLYNQHGQQTGCIVTVLLDKRISVFQKYKLEEKIVTYCHDVLYPNEGISLYRNIEKDTASITVVRDINELPSKISDIYSWE